LGKTPQFDKQKKKKQNTSSSSVRNSHGVHGEQLFNWTHKGRSLGRKAATPLLNRLQDVDEQRGNPHGRGIKSTGKNEKKQAKERKRRVTVKKKKKKECRQF